MEVPLRRPYGPGLLYSNDEGITWNIWTDLAMPDNVYIDAMEFSSKFPDILYGIWRASDTESLFLLNTGNDYNITLNLDAGSYSILPIEIENATLGWGNDICDLSVINHDDNGIPVERIFVSSATQTNYDSSILAFTDDFGITWNNISSSLVSYNMNWIIDSDFELSGDEDYFDGSWDDDGWGVFHNLSGNTVAGNSNPIALLQTAFEAGNSLRTSPLTKASLPIDQNFCFHYHLPANTKLEVWFKIGQNSSVAPRWHHKMWETSMVQNEVESDVCIPLVFPNGMGELYADHILDAFDPFDQHQVNSITNFDNKKFSLLFRVVKENNFVYVDDGDISDLPYIDNVTLIANSGENLRRIDIDSQDHITLFVRENLTAVDQHWTEKLNWNLIPEVLYELEGGLQSVGTYWNSLFEVSPNSSFLYYGSIALVIRDLNNSQMAQFPSGIHDDNRSVSFENNGTQNISAFIGTDGGLVYTPDNGNQWDHYGVISNSQIYGFDKSNNWMMIGLLDNGFYASFDGAFESHLGGDGGRQVFNESGTICMSTTNESIHLRKLDANNNIFTQGVANVPIFVEDWYVDVEVASSENNFFVLEKHVYKMDEASSLGSAPAFTKLIVPDSTDTNNRGRHNTIAISKSNPEIMYIAESRQVYSDVITDVKHKVYKTVDGGTTWIDLTSPLPNNENILLREAYLHFAIRDMLVSPTDPNKVWACFQGIGLDESGSALSRVLKSSDGGTTWVDISAGLAPFPVHNLEYQEGTNDRIYAGTDVGVYYRDGWMSEWQCFNTGLPLCVVTDLYLGYFQ